MFENYSDSELIFCLLISIAIWLFIVHKIISSAVREATKSQDYKLKIQNRLLIKLLMKQGVDKDELKEIHNQDDDDFWEKLDQKVTNLNVPEAVGNLSDDFTKK